MYREKLISQIEVFENAQKVCAITDIPEFVELSDNILKLAKKVDELDENATAEMNVHVDIDSQDVYEAVCKANDEYRQKHAASPFETMEQATKEALEEISD